MTDQPTAELATPEQTQEQAKRDRGAEARVFLGRLAERYPECFTRDRDKVRPLAIGTQQKLRAELLADPEWAEAPGWLVRQALSIYTRSAAYLNAIVQRRPRINLDGTPAGEVSDQEQAHAKERLDEIKARQAARRPQKPRRPPRGQQQPRPQQQQQRPRQQQRPQPSPQDAEQRTQSKLEQLAAKFAKR